MLVAKDPVHVVKLGSLGPGRTFRKAPGETLWLATDTIQFSLRLCVALERGAAVRICCDTDVVPEHYQAVRV